MTRIAKTARQQIHVHHRDTETRRKAESKAKAEHTEVAEATEGSWVSALNLGHWSDGRRGAGALACWVETHEVVEFAMSSVRVDGKHYGHGWTRIHTDKTKSLLIRVNPCPSVAKLVLRSWAQSYSAQVPKLWIDLRNPESRRCPEECLRHNTKREVLWR